MHVQPMPGLPPLPTLPENPSLLARLRECERVRDRMPNLVAAAYTRVTAEG